MPRATLKKVRISGEMGAEEVSMILQFPPNSSLTFLKTV
jgi:hypothetical protein